MTIKVQTMNTLYTIIEADGVIYISGHAIYCKLPLACKSISIADHMAFTPLDGKTIWTSPIQHVSITSDMV